MAYKKNKKRTTAKKPYRRSTRKVARRSGVRVMRNPGRSLIADRYSTKMVYSDTYNPSNVANTITWTQFRLGGIFDPDYLIGGHQPMGFDQLAVIYGRYIVTGCKVIIEGRFRSSNMDTNPICANLLIGAAPLANMVLPTTLSIANESRQYWTRTYSDQEAVRFSKYFNLAKINGCTKQQYMIEENYTGANNADPQKNTLLNIGFVPTGSEVTNFQHTVTLVYYVTWYSPNYVPPS
ncbi:MAG: capsid protein [Circoviridae sp.]|nr:MAG: capsid protein [Circoviridae sp.]